MFTYNIYILKKFQKIMTAPPLDMVTPRNSKTTRMSNICSQGYEANFNRVNREKVSFLHCSKVSHSPNIQQTNSVKIGHYNNSLVLIL